MIPRPPRSTPPDPLFPSTTLFRSAGAARTLLREVRSARVIAHAAAIAPVPAPALAADGVPLPAARTGLHDERLRGGVTIPEARHWARLGRHEEGDRKSTRLNSSH